MSRLATLLALCAMLIAPAVAHEYTVGSLHIGHPWSRATPKGAAIGAGYLKITNNGTAPDRLLGGSSEAAKSFELHVMSMENGVMKMRPVEGGIEIKPGETVEFKPESYQAIFVGLKEPLVQGHRVKATLDFAKAGKVAVEFVVESIGARQGNDDHAMPGMPHH
jgi:copper(I)-binding protein